VLDASSEQRFPGLAEVARAPTLAEPRRAVATLRDRFDAGITQSLGITVDDVQFVRDVIAHVEAEYRIDSRRVYAAGFSNGAMMTHRLAADLPDLLAGVALAEGTVGRDQGDGTWASIPEPAPRSRSS
jgi:poly(3-hydroxybutyrate) depolymerase